MAHPLPPEVVLVQCFCFEGGKWFVQATDFTHYCEQIPLLGMLALGHQKFAPKELDVDAHGMLTISVLRDMEITLYHFLKFIEIMCVPETAYLTPTMLSDVKIVAEKLCSYSLLQPFLNRYQEEMRLSLRSEEEDVDHVYDWRTVGPFSPYLPFNFTLQEQEGWSFVRTHNIRKMSILYLFRRKKV